MRRLARAGLRGVRLLAADAAAAPPLSGAGAVSARAAPLSAAALRGQAAAAHGAPAAAASRALAAPSRALTTSAASATDKADAGAEAAQQPPTADAAAEPAAESTGRSYKSHRSREGPRRGARIKPPRAVKAAATGSQDHILPMNIKLWGLIKEGKHDESKALFERWREGKELQDDGATPLAFEPDVFSYQHYLSACVQEKDPSKAGLELLEATLAEMKERGIAPRQSIFNPFAWMAFNLNDWGMAKRLYDVILSHDVVPSDVAYSYFFSLAVAAEDVRAAGDILAAAKASNKLQPGKDSARVISACNEVFYAAVKKRMHDIAANALSVVRTHGALPPSSSLIELAAGTADVDNTECSLAALSALAAKPDEHRYTMDEGSAAALLASAARNRDAALARAGIAQLEATLQARGAVPPSAVSQVSLLACAALLGDVPAAFRAANALRHLGVAPPALMKPLVDLLVQGGAAALDEAYFVAERMHKAGQLQGDGTVNVLNAIIAACARSRDMERAFQTFEVIEPVFGVPLTTGAFNGLLAACIATRSESAVANVVDEMRAKGLPHDDATRLLLLEAGLGLRDTAGVIDVLGAMLKAGGHNELSTTMRSRIQTLSRRGDEETQAKIYELIGKFKSTGTYVLRSKADLGLA